MHPEPVRHPCIALSSDNVNSISPHEPMGMFASQVQVMLKQMWPNGWISYGVETCSENKELEQITIYSRLSNSKLDQRAIIAKVKTVISYRQVKT